MSNVAVVECEVRDSLGKYSTSKLRKSGMVPGVIYLKDKRSTLCVAFDELLIRKLIGDYTFETKIVELSVDGRKILAIPRDVQFHAITDTPAHLDFMEVAMGEMVIVSIPVVLLNRDLSVGVKRGGNVFLMKYNISVRAPVGHIPDGIKLDVAGSDVGDKFMLSSLPLDEKVEILQDCLVARVSGPRKKIVADAAATVAVKK